MHVVVIGGGIVGLATAYELAERDVAVTVLERSTLGSGSTERSAGGIRHQYSTPVNVDLSRESAELWASFEATFGIDIAYRRNGYLFLAHEASTAEGFRENVAMQTDRGVPSEYVEPADVPDICPGVDPAGIEGATYCPIDGFADPHLAVQGYAQALGGREAVDVRTKTAATAIHRANGGDGNEEGRVTAVETPDGRIEADYVVNAAGAWAGRIAAMAGVDLPITPERRQLSVVDPEEPLDEGLPLVIALDRDSYFRPEREGAALVGGHAAAESLAADPDAYSTTMDTDWAVAAVERAGSYARYFGPETRIKNGWAGLYAMTPDHHPVIEETVPGFVTAAGFSGHGFQQAPATGRIVAGIVTEGEASFVDVSALTSDRFDEDGGGLVERNVA